MTSNSVLVVIIIINTVTDIIMIVLFDVYHVVISFVLLLTQLTKEFHSLLI